MHVFLFDDITRDALLATQEVYRFLKVDSGFAPDFDTPHAAGGMPVSRLLEGFLTSSALRSVIRPLVPVRAANWVRRLRSRTMRKAPRLPPQLRQELTEHFREDIAKTSKLIGRSLDHWL
jgi:hypothetical protein